MAYDVPATRPGRPTVVTAAVACLFVLAGVQLVSAVITVVAYGPMIDAARDYAGGTSDGDIVVTSLQIGRYGGFAIAAIFAIGYAVLGMFTGRGKNVARIIAWVVLGIGLCCNAGSLVSTAAGGMLNTSGSSSTGSVDMDELQRRMQDATPGWSTVAAYLLLAVSLIAGLAAVILLALPAANEFFRKVQPAWEPPVPGATYYPTPGQPAQAGEPAQPEPPASPVQFDKRDDSDQPGGGFAPPGP